MKENGDLLGEGGNKEGRIGFFALSWFIADHVVTSPEIFSGFHSGAVLMCARPTRDEGPKVNRLVKR